jgi:hypothetical protein
MYACKLYVYLSLLLVMCIPSFCSPTPPHFFFSNPMIQEMDRLERGYDWSVVTPDLLRSAVCAAQGRSAHLKKDADWSACTVNSTVITYVATGCPWRKFIYNHMLDYRCRNTLTTNENNLRLPRPALHPIQCYFIPHPTRSITCCVPSNRDRIHQWVKLM